MKIPFLGGALCVVVVYVHLEGPNVNRLEDQLAHLEDHQPYGPHEVQL